MQKISRQSFCLQSLLAGAGGLLQAQAGNAQSNPPKRLLIFQQALGYLPEHFYPKKDGKLDALPEYFESFENLKNNLTIMSGLSHHGLVGSNHYAVNSYLTGTPKASFGGQNTISMDQYLSQNLNLGLRYDVLKMCTINESISYDNLGRKLPSYYKDSELYDELFKKHTESDIQKLEEKYDRELFLLENPSHLAYHNMETRKNYEEMLQTQRELVLNKKKWLRVAKPQTSLELKNSIINNNLETRLHNMFDMAKEAFIHDQCRIAIIYVPFGNTQWTIDGGKYPWHTLTHHGKKEDRLEKLRTMENSMMKLFAQKIQAFKNTKEGNGSLLDSTVMFFGSDMGNANAHSPLNLPLFLAGGPFQTGEHHAYSSKNNEPLCNLFLNLFDHMGLQVDHFSKSNGRLQGFNV